ncbi:TIGR03016 family PEP-CTERM system-associated outer membrane protein [Undibacterium sp. Jales W-56]|uniref:TIGR03016 family PEP-CTERM system-associated outer membrane protein n=1 Tax=Undibacterium sp. Jales W-56 TaxID=2897325 RepID=UPI0021D362FF|nr:TIGR03016 family PEP-CTERM system-associated outer membrane protein [Undibacterium sp. Jales W-56]MCU6434113.1 TIGR03016 family PEP-CTERM system-associated outer membrane protein [Undibacterium sp. Jales W-56]
MAIITAKKMRRWQANSLTLGLTSIIPLLGIGATVSVSAAEWKVTPTINVSESYTDNIRLTQNAESSYITQVAPGINLTATGAQLRFRADYVMQNLRYSSNHNGFKTSHLLNASANSELVKELFFLDGSANISQQNLNPFTDQPTNNLNLSNNRTEVRTYSVSPYFRKNFSPEFTAELRYTRDSVKTSTKNVFDSTGDRILFDLKSGSTYKTISWGLQFVDQKIHYPNQADVELQTSTLNGSYAVSPLFSLTATTGYENNTYVSIGEKPSGTFWTGGFSWTPTERTRFAFSAGKRFYGSTYSALINERARASVWSLGYNEDITTTRGQYLIPATTSTSAFLNQLWKASVPDSNTRQQLVDNFIRDTNLPSALAQPFNTVTNRVFLQKNLQASVAFTGAQNTVLLNAFNVKREAQSASQADILLLGISNPALLEKIRQTGVNALWNWQLSPRTSANISTAYTQTASANTGIKDNTKTARASVSRQLQSKLRATVEVRRVEKKSNLANGTGNFNENAITLFLLLGF